MCARVCVRMLFDSDDDDHHVDHRAVALRLSLAQRLYLSMRREGRPKKTTTVACNKSANIVTVDFGSGKTDASARVRQVIECRHTIADQLPFQSHSKATCTRTCSKITARVLL